MDTNEKLRNTAIDIAVTLNVFGALKPGNVDGAVDLIFGKLCPLFPKAGSVEENELAEACARLDAGDTSCLIIDSISILHALRAARQEVAELRRRNQAYADVDKRRDAQNAKWGVQNHDPITWSAILTEECGEFAQAALHNKFGGSHANGLRDEAIDCAAVAIQIIEYLDRAAGEGKGAT